MYLCCQAVGMKRDLEAQINELQGDISREQTEVSRLRDHNSQLRNQLSDKENKQVKVCTVQGCPSTCICDNRMCTSRDAT